jgi:predicted ester cyclase
VAAREGSLMGTLLAPVRWLARFPIFHSLRLRLTLLVLFGSLPAIVLLLLTASQQRNDAINEGQETANRLVRLAAVDQRRIFDQAQILLTTVARLPEVRGKNAEVCSSLMAELLDINTSFDNLGVVNHDGSIFCSGIAGDLSVILNDRRFVEQAFATNDFVIGTYGLGPLSNEPTVTYAAPVPNGGGSPDRIVFASLDLTALDTFANIANLPEGAVFRVYDREGVLLLQSPSDPSVIGRSFAKDPVVRRMIDDPTGSSLRQLDDPDRIYAGEWIQVQGSSGTPPGAAFVTVSIPKEATVAHANDTFQENMSRLGLAALVAVALSWVGADLFMSRDSETRKTLVADIYRVYESGDLARLDDIIAVDVTDRSPAPGQVQGLSGYKQLVGQFRAAFPDGKVEPEELLADGDKVIAKVRLSGTQVNDFFGLKPSGKPVAAKGVETFRFANGVVVEMWSMFTPLVVVKAPPVAPEPMREAEPKRRGLLRRIAGIFRREDRS